MLELLTECVACEDVDHTEEVDMLLISAQQPTILGLVESDLFLEVACALYIEGIERVKRRSSIFRCANNRSVTQTISPRQESTRVLRAIMDSDQQ